MQKYENYLKTFFPHIGDISHNFFTIQIMAIDMPEYIKLNAQRPHTFSRVNNQYNKLKAPSINYFTSQIYTILYTMRYY